MQSQLGSIGKVFTHRNADIPHSRQPLCFLGAHLGRDGLGGKVRNRVLRRLDTANRIRSVSPLPTMTTHRGGTRGPYAACAALTARSLELPLKHRLPAAVRGTTVHRDDDDGKAPEAEALQPTLNKRDPWCFPSAGPPLSTAMVRWAFIFARPPKKEQRTKEEKRNETKLEKGAVVV